MVEEGSPTVRRRRLAAELRRCARRRAAAASPWRTHFAGRPRRSAGTSEPRPDCVPGRSSGCSTTTASPARTARCCSRSPQDASQKGWWEEYADSLPEDYQQFIGLEHEATAVAIWHVDVVAGLLQTEAYARHIIDSYDRVEPVPPSQVTRLVRVRMRRQQVLDRPGLKLSVVLDESVLLRRIGSDLTMYEQLQRLAKECERPNLTLQVLPLDGPHTVIGESFVLFGFEADGDAVLQDVVSTEQMRSGFIIEGERETHLHRVAFRTLTEAALSPADSKQMILDLAESLWNGRSRTAS